MYQKYFKRLFDIMLSGMALIILSPILLLVAILVRMKLGSPVIFKQERPGMNGKTFVMLKFRTMIDSQTKDGVKMTDSERLECIRNGVAVLSDEERLTKLGRFLRLTSLDELPELLNILIGNMSVVGPRPLATIYLPYYNKHEMHRHDVRPGLTGLAQISGRNSVFWEERFNYDIEYVNKITILNDLKILFKTLAVVFSHNDIGQGTERPEPFSIVRQREWDKAN